MIQQQGRVQVSFKNVSEQGHDMFYVNTHPFMTLVGIWEGEKSFHIQLSPLEEQQTKRSIKYKQFANEQSVEKYLNKLNYNY